jgi:hypothetical protein
MRTIVSVDQTLQLGRQLRKGGCEKVAVKGRFEVYPRPGTDGFVRSLEKRDVLPRRGGVRNQGS